MVANPRCNARKRVSSPSRPALELLAASPQGCTEALLSAHGVTVKILADLVRAGLATATAENTRSRCLSGSMKAHFRIAFPLRIGAMYFRIAIGMQSR